MFSMVTVPLLIVSVPLIVDVELLIEKPLLYPPIRETDILPLKLSVSWYVPV